MTLVLMLSALMSKPMAVTLPLIMLLFDFYPLNRFTSATANLWVLWEKIPFLILSLITAITTIQAQSEEATASLEYLPLLARLLNAIRSLAFYLQKMIVPSNLAPFYPYPLKIYVYDAGYIIAGIMVLCISVGCFWMVKKKRYVFFSVWTYYVVTLLPVLGIVQVGQQAAADRYTYLPSAGVFLLVGIGASLLYQRMYLLRQNIILIGLFVGIIISITFLLVRLTILQIGIWKNSDTLWTYVINTFPNTVPLAHVNLGTA
jgi:hypothetical protein